MVHNVLPQLPLISVRTEYRDDGYRAHSDDSRRIEVTYSDYHGRDLDTLIIPDTYATGRSVEAALQHMISNGGNPRTIIIYGFIAIPSMRRLSALCKNMGSRLITFAICDITQLAANNYDMTLFGIDEHHHSETGELNLLGSVVGEETLQEICPRTLYPASTSPETGANGRRSCTTGTIRSPVISGGISPSPSRSSSPSIG